MVDLVEVESFLKWYASQDPYIQHSDSIKTQNRFARTATEAEELSKSVLYYPRLEMIELPHGKLNDNKAGYQWDEMSVAVRVIALVPKKEFTLEETEKNNCKKALMRLALYINEARSNGGCCDTDILCSFDMNKIGYQFIENVTTAGNSVGCEMRLHFRADMDLTNLVAGIYPPLIDLNVDSVPVWDAGTKQYRFVPLSDLGGGGGGTAIPEKRYDYVAPYSYCGTAPEGTANNTAAWVITRIGTDISGAAEIKTASNVAWNNRLTAIYN